MRSVFRLLILGGILAAAWAYLRQLLEDGDRPPMQRVEEAAKTAAGSAKDAAESAKDAVTSVTTGGNGTADLSKAELYREAQKLDVEGRSKMSKDELAAAVARARRSS